MKVKALVVVEQDVNTKRNLFQRVTRICNQDGRLVYITGLSKFAGKRFLERSDPLEVNETGVG